MHTTAVIIIDVVTILSVCLIIGIGPYIKKVTNNYFFWLTLSLCLLIYLSIFRFYDEFSDFWKHGNDHSVRTSRGLLLDICPFCSFLICAVLIADPTRKLAKITAPFGLFGGLITILGGIGDEMINIGDLPMWKYIFIGDSANPMYFMMHYLNVVLSVLILVSVPKMRFADWIYCNFFAATYYGYVGICMVSLNVTDHVSGLNLNDWDLGGEYSGVAEIFKVGPAAAAAIGFSLSYLCISGIIWGQSCLQKFKRYRWYDMWNKKTWYFGWYLLTPTEIKEPKSLLYRLKKILIHGFRK